MNGCLSNYVRISTGSPQDCVLSSLLYTNNCKSDHENKFLIKFSDDTAVVSLLFGDQNDHGHVVSDFVISDFVNWCHDSYLCLNVNKQWEVIALEQLTSHMTLNAGPQQRPESPTITPPGMR